MVSISSFLGLEMKMNSGSNEWVYVVPGHDKVQLYNKSVKDYFVPDVRGMVLSDAVYLLENLGLDVQATGYGKINYQSLLPGTRINKNTVIRLKLSSILD